MIDPIESRSLGGDRERRYKFFAVTGQQILTLLGNWHHEDFLRLPRIKDLPEGYRVLAIISERLFAEDCFLLKVYHPSFEALDPNQTIPRYPVAEFDAIDLRMTTKESPTAEATPMTTKTKAFEFLGKP